MTTAVSAASDPARLAAFAFLGEQARLRNEQFPPVLPRELLSEGFVLSGQRVPLIGPQGIFKPAAVRDGIPLSITTAPPVLGRPAPYDDQLSDDGTLSYRYRGTDPLHHENVGLRRAMQTRTPLIYFQGLVPGRYLCMWPAYVVAEDPRDLAFIVEVAVGVAPEIRESSGDAEVIRRYAMREVRQRMHQAGFHQRVLAAYHRTCALCRLRHEELLDAAHIIPDGRPGGDPVVPNGLALCKIHHRAFDVNILGIRPDLVVEVRRDVLHEVDGPMLQHGLQGLHGGRVTVPRHILLRPSHERLEERYEEFRKAS